MGKKNKKKNKHKKATPQRTPDGKNDTQDKENIEVAHPICEAEKKQDENEKTIATATSNIFMEIIEKANEGKDFISLPVHGIEKPSTEPVSRYAAIADLDRELIDEDERWEDRTSVITRWQHEEYVEFASQFFEEMVLSAIGLSEGVPNVYRSGPNETLGSEPESDLDASFQSTKTALGPPGYHHASGIIGSDESEYESAAETSLVDTGSKPSVSVKDDLDELIGGLESFQIKSVHKTNDMPTVSTPPSVDQVLFGLVKQPSKTLEDSFLAAFDSMNVVTTNEMLHQEDDLNETLTETNPVGNEPPNTLILPALEKLINLSFGSPQVEKAVFSQPLQSQAALDLLEVFNSKTDNINSDNSGLFPTSEDFPSEQDSLNHVNNEKLEISPNPANESQPFEVAPGDFTIQEPVAIGSYFQKEEVQDELYENNLMSGEIDLNSAANKSGYFPELESDNVVNVPFAKTDVSLVNTCGEIPPENIQLNHTKKEKEEHKNSLEKDVINLTELMEPSKDISFSNQEQTVLAQNLVSQQIEVDHEQPNYGNFENDEDSQGIVKADVFPLSSDPFLSANEKLSHLIDDCEAVGTTTSGKDKISLSVLNPEEALESEATDRLSVEGENSHSNYFAEESQGKSEATIQDATNSVEGKESTDVECVVESSSQILTSFGNHLSGTICDSFDKPPTLDTDTELTDHDDCLKTDKIEAEVQLAHDNDDASNDGVLRIDFNEPNIGLMNSDDQDMMEIDGELGFGTDQEAANSTTNIVSLMQQSEVTSICESSSNKACLDAPDGSLDTRAHVEDLAIISNTNKYEEPDELSSDKDKSSSESISTEEAHLDNADSILKLIPAVEPVPNVTTPSMSKVFKNIVEVKDASTPQNEVVHSIRPGTPTKKVSCTDPSEAENIKRHLFDSPVQVSKPTAIVKPSLECVVTPDNKPMTKAAHEETNIPDKKQPCLEQPESVKAMDSIGMRGAYDLNSILDDPNFNPFQTKSSGIRNSFGTSSPPLQTTENLQIQSSSDLQNEQPTRSEESKEKSVSARNRSLLNRGKTSSNDTETNAIPEGEKKEKKPLPPKPWLRKKSNVARQAPSEEIEIFMPEKKVVSPQKDMQPVHSGIGDSKDSVTEARSSSPPLPKPKEYSLDFLDNLDDPNFNPFETKSSVKTDEQVSNDDPPPLEVLPPLKGDFLRVDTTDSTTHLKDSTPEFEAVEKEIAQSEKVVRANVEATPDVVPRTIKMDENSPLKLAETLKNEMFDFSTLEAESVSFISTEKPTFLSTTFDPCKSFIEKSSIDMSMATQKLVFDQNVSICDIVMSRDPLDPVREALARKELLYQAQLLEKDKELHKRERDVQELEKEIDSMKLTLVRSNNSYMDMGRVLREYESTISELTSERERERACMEIEKERLIRERDESLADLRSVERSFSDTHRRYERMKEVIGDFKKNEDSLKASLELVTAKLQRAEERFDRLRDQAQSKLNEANEALANVRKQREGEVAKLQAMIRKAEMRVSMLERTIEEKNHENLELTNICDELIARVGQ